MYYTKCSAFSQIMFVEEMRTTRARPAKRRKPDSHGTCLPISTLRSRLKILRRHRSWCLLRGTASRVAAPSLYHEPKVRASENILYHLKFMLPCLSEHLSLPMAWLGSNQKEAGDLATPRKIRHIPKSVLQCQGTHETCHLDPRGGYKAVPDEE
jgi:hypothetical protein